MKLSESKIQQPKQQLFGLTPPLALSASRGLLSSGWRSAQRTDQSASRRGVAKLIDAAVNNVNKVTVAATKLAKTENDWPHRLKGNPWVSCWVKVSQSSAWRVRWFLQPITAQLRRTCDVSCSSWVAWVRLQDVSGSDLQEFRLTLTVLGGL